MTDLSLHFNGHFPGEPGPEPGLAGTRMSPFWILLKLRVLEVVVTTGAIRRAPVKMLCHQQTDTRFLQARIPSCCPNNSVKALKGTCCLMTDHDIIKFTVISPSEVAKQD